MQADLKWLDDPTVFRVNQMPAHSDHMFFACEEAAQNGQSDLVQSLNGTWDFCYSPNTASRPADFYKIDADRTQFTSIKVPGHIELAGYDKIHYINTMYPWEAHYYRRPQGVCAEHPDGVGSFAEAEYNPVGSYCKQFDLEPSMIGKHISVFFEGVEQAVYVWLNGHFIGYAEDSFTPSEFDLTPFIRPHGNLLAAEVHKHSTAAYLEDQDFFRFFGIFRNVCLIARPEIHAEDLDLCPILNSDLSSGVLRCTVKLSGETEGGKAVLSLEDQTGEIIYSCRKETAEILQMESDMLTGIKPWNFGSPNLYRTVLRLYDRENKLTEISYCKIGFRRIEMVDKVIFLNGRRLKICGVNRHEWSPETGRAISVREMKKDIVILRRLHINAVRTSHYPNQIPWYAMCDEAGIYVMAETNLESHGSWQKMGAVEPSWNVPGDSLLWENAVVDRARSNYELLKNHPSVLFWSLGNESYAGTGLLAMEKFFKERRDGRITHYEGVFRNRAYEDRISDVESQMYPTPAAVEAYLKNKPAKPFILCEFMHSMGNSVGGLKEYMELFDKYPMFQGGFIWDFIDQALYVRDEATGGAVLRYGGDFDDRPSDYAFSGNGIVFADRTEKPAAQEVSYYYETYEA